MGLTLTLPTFPWPQEIRATLRKRCVLAPTPIPILIPTSFGITTWADAAHELRVRVRRILIVFRGSIWVR